MIRKLVRYRQQHVDQAILVLQISASADEYFGGFTNIGQLLGWDHGFLWRENPAFKLAYAAWDEAWSNLRAGDVADDSSEDWMAELDAEAAALLEEGWRP